MEIINTNHLEYEIKFGDKIIKAEIDYPTFEYESDDYDSDIYGVDWLMLSNGDNQVNVEFTSDSLRYIANFRDCEVECCTESNRITKTLNTLYGGEEDCTKEEACELLNLTEEEFNLILSNNKIIDMIDDITQEYLEEHLRDRR